MGVIFGVGVAQEPKADGYLRGQLWNRPSTEPDEWILFRIQSLSRISYPGVSPTGAVFINSQIVPPPAFGEDGLAPSLGLPVLFGDYFFNDAIYECGRAYLQLLSIDPEGYPRLYPPLGARLEATWRAEAGKDGSSSYSGVLAYNTILGVKLSEIRRQVAEPECRIAFSSRAYLITQDINFNYEGFGLIEAQTISMQKADSFTTDYEEADLVYLAVPENQRLASAFKFSGSSPGVQLFAASAPIDTYGQGSELISSFILNLEDLSLSRAEQLLAVPSDSAPIPVPTWNPIPYESSFEALY
jgi:hypothetical protein